MKGETSMLSQSSAVGAKGEDMRPTEVRPSDSVWKVGGGYYVETVEELRNQPLLPDPRRLPDRRLLALFEQYANLTVGSRVLEVGCGRSPWLPLLALQMGCSVVGVDIEPFAAELARANLSGAGAKGEVLCRDALDLTQNEDLVGRFDVVYSLGFIEHFDDTIRRLGVLARYLKPGGRILTTVPNLQGVNWLLQRLGDLERLEMHVIYDSKKLTRVHEAAGFETIAAGYMGFYDGYVTAVGESAGRARRWIHGWLCWATGMCSAAWLRVARGVDTPEFSWIAPHVFYVGRRVSG
jgi:SAM-dependent methyltransferase